PPKPEEITKALTDERRRRRGELAADLARQKEALKAVPAPPMVYAANPRTPEPTYLLLRGDVESRGDRMTPGSLSAVRSPSPEFGLPADAPEAERRRRLADWIADPANPLTPRALVNRVWHYH